MTIGDIAILEDGLEQAAEAAEGVAQAPERVSVPSAPSIPDTPGRPLSLHEERQLEIQKYEQQQSSQAGGQTSADRLRSMGITVNSDR